MTAKETRFGSARRAFILRVIMTVAKATSSTVTLRVFGISNTVLAVAKPASSRRSAEVRKAGRYLRGAELSATVSVIVYTCLLFDFCQFL